MTPEEDLASAALARAVREQNQRCPRTPIVVGPMVEYPTQKIQTVCVMKPCRRGAPTGTAMFVSLTVEGAIRDARLFVEAMTPSEEE